VVARQGDPAHGLVLSAIERTVQSLDVFWSAIDVVTEGHQQRIVHSVLKNEAFDCLYEGREEIIATVHVANRKHGTNCRRWRPQPVANLD
jgi:hypothetical protein